MLDTHYGDIRTVLPRLRAKLDKLPSHPVKETDENRNIQQILNYWKTARNHGIEERAVDVFFIQEYSEKLSKENKKLIINLELMSPALSSNAAGDINISIYLNSYRSRRIV